MVLIRKTNVPQYLRTGSLFSSLNGDGEEQFEVPSECLKLVPEIGSIDDLKYVLRSLQYWEVADLPNAAIQYIFQSGDIATITKLEKEYPDFGSALARTQRLKILEINQSESDKKSSEAQGPIDAAIANDFGLEMVQWLHKQHFRVSEIEIARAASADRHLDILKYFVEEVGCGKEPFVTEASIKGGSIVCLQYLLDRGFPLPDQCITIACACRQPHALTFLLKRGVEFSSRDVIRTATLVQSVECLKILQGAECPFEGELIEQGMLLALEHGNLECLIFWHRAGVVITEPWCTEWCVVTALHGHVHCLKYLHEHGCPWDSEVKDIAYSEGSYSCLKYIHEHGCPWEGRDFRLSRSPKCIAYAMIHGDAWARVLFLYCATVVCCIVSNTLYHFCVEYYQSVVSILFWSAMHAAMGWYVFVLYFYVRYFRSEK